MPANKIRVIVDTNIWISSLIGRQLLSLRELLSYPQIELVITERLMQEVLLVAQRPKFAKYFRPSSTKGRSTKYEGDTDYHRFVSIGGAEQGPLG